MKIFKYFSEFMKAISDFLYPPLCLSCLLPLLGNKQPTLCEECLGKIKYIGDNSCNFCSCALGKYIQRQGSCDECRGKKRRYTRVVAALEYDDLARSIVHSFKFQNQKRLSHLLADIMVERISEEYSKLSFDYIIPVPLHKKKYFQRGYNQSALLAEHISNRLLLKYAPSLLRRVRNTTSQALLSMEERENNLSGAFSINTEITGSTVLLVDDVFTTGSTASECANELRKAGAKRVYVIVFAR